MGLLYTCEGIVRKPLGSVYACVCRVLAVRVMESVLHVGDEVGVRLIFNFRRSFLKFVSPKSEVVQHQFLF